MVQVSDSPRLCKIRKLRYILYKSLKKDAVLEFYLGATDIWRMMGKVPE